MAEPIKTVTLGGLTYNANDVAKTSEVTDEKGQKIFIIDFKTGERMKFPEQPVQVQVKNPEESTFAVRGDGRRVEKDRYEYEGAVDYNGNAKDGVTFHKELHPKVTLNVDKGWVYDTAKYDISEVMGATFTTSKESIAKVNLNNSYGCKIDLAKNESKYYGDHVTIKDGENNTVKLDKEDSARINGKLVEGKGEADQKDYE